MASSRPSDYIGSGDNLDEIASPALGTGGWLRWIWRQLTSMRTALILLLLLAVASVPGSVYPQRSADPNGVAKFFKDQPELAVVLDSLQLFDVYTSVWFSAIYILLFVSLIGCVVPRSFAHATALRQKPVQTPKNLSRMPVHVAVVPAIQDLPEGDSSPATASQIEFLNRAEAELRKARYRVRRFEDSVSAERGYSRETGNLVFHLSLVGLLIAVGLGGGLSFNGQRVLVEGETFVNNLAGYDSFSPGVLFDESQLRGFSLTLEKFEVSYDLNNIENRGIPIDFRATVLSRASAGADPKSAVIRVNEPLETEGGNVYLTGNGFAPVVTIRDGEGNIAFSGPTPFLPQDGNMTSLGIIKVPDAVPTQIGIISFFYPTAEKLESDAYTSIYPDPFIPLLTMNVYVGDLGLDEGIPRNVYALDTSELTQVAGRDADVPGLELEPGETLDLPNGIGTVTFDGLRRFASLDVAYNPGQVWVLVFAMIALAGLVASLLIPRRRIWVKTTPEGFEVAGLARGDDPKLQQAVTQLADSIENGRND